MTALFGILPAFPVHYIQNLRKTGRPHDAMRRLTQARAVALDAKLGRFLDGLERRIRRVLTDRLVLAVYWLPGIFL